MPHHDSDDHDHDYDDDHETILQGVIRALLTSDDLDELSRDAGTAVLIDRDGEPVTVSSALTYDDAGVLTYDKGVYVELSDGSRFGVTISVSSRGHGDVTVRPPDRSTGAGAPRDASQDRNAPDDLPTVVAPAAIVLDTTTNGGTVTG